MQQLINKTGQAVTLPATLKDFRGDSVRVIGFTAPHKPSSTGRVHTSDGMSYYPSVVGCRIGEV